MRNIIFLLINACFSLVVTAQKLSSDKVPVTAKKAFEQAHPGLKGIWEKENRNYEVNFKENDKTMSSVIDKNGKIVETETTIAVSELPAAASQYLKTHYKNTKIHEASSIVKTNGEVNYEANINRKDIIFDANGKFIKIAKD